MLIFYLKIESLSNKISHLKKPKMNIKFIKINES